MRETQQRVEVKKDVSNVETKNPRKGIRERETEREREDSVYIRRDTERKMGQKERRALLVGIEPIVSCACNAG